MTTMAGVYFSVAVTLTTDMIKHLIIVIVGKDKRLNKKKPYVFGHIVRSW